MNVSIDRVSFQKSLSFLKAVAGTTGSVTVEGDADGNCHLRALDLSVGLNLDLIVAGSVVEPGIVSAPLRNLPAMVKHMAESVPVSLSEDAVLFGDHARRLTLHSLQVPQFASPDYSREIRIGAQVFAKALDMAAHSAANGYDRPNLCAVSLDFQDEQAKLVSTDGFRLSIVDLHADSQDLDGQLLIPDTAWKLLSKMVKPLAKDRDASIFIRWDNDDNDVPQNMTFGWKSAKCPFEVANVNTTVMDAHFPDWRRIAYGVRDSYGESEINLRAMEAAVPGRGGPDGGPRQPDLPVRAGIRHPLLLRGGPAVFVRQQERQCRLRGPGGRRSRPRPGCVLQRHFPEQVPGGGRTADRPPAGLVLRRRRGNPQGQAPRLLPVQQRAVSADADVARQVVPLSGGRFSRPPLPRRTQ